MAQQISKKFLGDNQVDGSKIKIEQGQSLVAVDHTGAAVDLLKIDSSTGQVTINGVQPASASDVSTAQSDIAALQSDNTTNKSDISTLKSDVSTAKSDISALESDVSAAQSDITELQSDVSAAQSSIGALQSSVSALESDVTALESDNVTNKSDISTLKSDMLTAKSDISALESQANGLESDVSTLLSDVSTAKSNISILQSDVSAAESDILALQTDVSAAQSDIGTLQSDVSSLQSDVSGKISSSEKGQANGVAPLNINGKIDSSYLPTSGLGALLYKGVFDASSGVFPSLPSQGDYYVVSVEGTISSHTYHVGDWIVYNGSSWDDIDNSQTVSSVNGKVGAVVVGSDDIAEGSVNKYFTDARAVSALATVTDQLSTDIQDLEAYAQDVRDDLDNEIIRAEAAEALKLNLSGGTMSGEIAMGSHKITGLGEPTANSTDAATTAYVDTAVSNVSVDLTPYMKKDGSVAMTGALDLGSHKISNVTDPTSEQDAATKKFVEDQNALKLSLSGGTMSGAIAMGSSKITGLGSPTAASTDAATAAYAESVASSAASLKLSLSGGTMSGAIAMGSSKITGLADPSVASQEAATAAYVDAAGGLSAGLNANGTNITMTASARKISVSSGAVSTKVILPPLADMVVGEQCFIVNSSSATLTIRNPGDSADIATVPTGHLAQITLANKSGAGTFGSSIMLLRTASGYNASSSKIINLAAATQNGDAVRYEQVLLLAGGTMSGAIAMGSNKITGLGSPTANSNDAATTAYVDAAVLAGGGASYEKESFSLSSADIANGYINLARLAKVKSIHASVGRLAIHEGATHDYTVSIVGGVSRITFLNSLVYPGVEALVAGDVIFVEYAY
jgi:peptidoglycan hydrolase CwlO-like protein